MDKSIIDLLAIEGDNQRIKKFELLAENAGQHQQSLANAYMKLAENFKVHLFV